MAISLRTRLTIWYSGLLLFAIAIFSATVLWLHWRLLIRQSDDALDALSTAAVNVVADELAEHASLFDAAGEMESVVRHPDYAVAVLDASGMPVRQSGLALPVVPPIRTPGLAQVSRSMEKSRDGRSWRLTLRTGERMGTTFTVAVAEPMEEITEQWRALVEACAIGIPFVGLIAIAGGWALGRRGLRPLATMAEQARTITAKTPGSRLALPPAAPELEDLATSFNRVLERLGNALATQRQFMADASHELRTPISIMRTAADVTLNQSGRDESEYREALLAVAQQSSRLARLVDDMLVLARADGGGYPMVRSEVDLDAVVADCVGEVSRRAGAKQIRLTSRLEPVTVRADEALLRRMLGNLLNNAVAYTPPGGVVEVAMVPQPGVISIRVADSGPGIAEQDRERVFERFVRLDPARSEGGAGLGLSIARWIAEAHGGRVELLASGPTGSVFSAWVPV